MRAGWIGVKTFSQGHHLLSIHLVGHGVVLGWFKFVNRDMFSAYVRGINVVEENVDVVNAIISGRVVDGEGPLDALLDDVSISVQRGGFNLMKRPF